MGGWNEKNDNGIIICPVDESKALINTMEDIRPILYGVSDYAELRRRNAWFVDRTAKIRDLEATPFAMFLRPRRFGKSLLVSMLHAYYDVNYADRFDELFSGTDIWRNPTEERGRYFILYFNFSAVEKIPSKAQESFNDYTSDWLDAFARTYASRIPEDVCRRILAAPDCGRKLNALTSGLSGTGAQVYVLIDEYDNFTNTILAEGGLAAYNDLCHGDGFFKQFFTELKAVTTRLDAPVKRIFITGVSPVTMDDVTSGFNIARNISLDPAFADWTGFRHDDLRAIADYYAPRCGFDAEKALDVALRWYDNYRFGDADAPPLANTTLVLSLFSDLWRNGRFPREFIDENLRTDYAKIRHLVTLDRRLNGNFHVLEELLAGGRLCEPLVESFQARELTRRENFTSLLYWFGITSITGWSFGTTEFGIPNETLKALAAKMIPDAYSDVHRIDDRVFEINRGLVAFAGHGDWRGFASTLCAVVKENFAVRDARDGEAVVQSTMVALLCAARGPYYVRHEGEAGGGFYDIALVPQLSRWPDIGHAALVELKYIKAGDPAPSAEGLAAIREAASSQLAKYASDGRLAAECNLPSVALHRVVMVFHGGECVLQEELQQ